MTNDGDTERVNFCGRRQTGATGTKIYDSARIGDAAETASVVAEAASREIDSIKRSTEPRTKVSRQFKPTLLDAYVYTCLKYLNRCLFCLS